MRYGIALMCCFLLSCEERFKFETDTSSQSYIAINGFINQSSGPFYVEIAKTQPTGIPTPIVGANVTLVDESGGKRQFKESDLGTYIYDIGDLKGEPGQAYSVEVTLLSGDRFVSDPDIMPQFTAAHSITWNEYLKTFTSDLGVDFDLPIVSIDLTVELPSTQQPLYLNYLSEELYQFVPTDFPDPFGTIPPPCYISQQFGTEQVNLFSNLGFAKPQFKISELFWREIDDSFVRKHIFSVYQYAISENYYNYLKGVKALVENSGSLFDTPPGQLIGNFKSIGETELSAIGFFSAYLSDTVRVAIYPSELETFIFEECLYRGGFNRDYDMLCIDCLLLPRSSYDRPDYWLNY